MKRYWLMAVLMLVAIGKATAFELVSPANYQIKTLSVGEKVYLDRDVTWVNVGPYAGVQFISGLNNEKQTGVITVRHTGKLYAAVQAGVATMPAGSGWAKTGDVMEAGVKYDVWAKDVVDQEVIQPVCPHGACNAVIVFAGEAEVRNPFIGTIDANWTHDYKSVPVDGEVIDVDVVHYLVYKGADVLRQVQDDDSGAASTAFIFPDEMDAYQGDRFCIRVSAVSYEQDEKHLRQLESEKSDEACIVLPIVDEPQPINTPSKPGSVSIQANVHSGALRLTIEP